MAEIFPESPLTSLPDAVAAMGALPVPVGSVPRTLAELETLLTTARTEAIADVGDWLDEVGEKGAAYLVRTVDIPAARAMRPVPTEPSCPCPPADQPGPHQLGCPQAEVPSPLFPTVAALREVLDGEHFATVHHDWLIGRDLPELGGAR